VTCTRALGGTETVDAGPVIAIVVGEAGSEHPGIRCVAHDANHLACWLPGAAPVAIALPFSRPATTLNLKAAPYTSPVHACGDSGTRIECVTVDWNGSAFEVGPVHLGVDAPAHRWRELYAPFGRGALVFCGRTDDAIECYDPHAPSGAQLVRVASRVALSAHDRCWVAKDGSATCGDGDKEPLEVPAPAGVVALAGSDPKTCALTAPGQVYCFGGLTAEGPDVGWVAGLDDAVDVGPAHDGMCALRKSGAVVCWPEREPDPRTGLVRSVPWDRPFTAPVQMMASSDESLCGLLADGWLECIDGTWPRMLPTLVARPGEVVAIAGSLGRVLAVRRDGSFAEVTDWDRTLQDDEEKGVPIAGRVACAPAGGDDYVCRTPAAGDVFAGGPAALHDALVVGLYGACIRGSGGFFCEPAALGRCWAGEKCDDARRATFVAVSGASAIAFSGSQRGRHERINHPESGSKNVCAIVDGVVRCPDSYLDGFRSATRLAVGWSNFACAVHASGRVACAGEPAYNGTGAVLEARRFLPMKVD
jgi:hypothetical protein